MLKPLIDHTKTWESRTYPNKRKNKKKTFTPNHNIAGNGKKLTKGNHPPKNKQCKKTHKNNISTQQ
jgi:hypothetical protein